MICGTVTSIGLVFCPTQLLGTTSYSSIRISSNSTALFAALRPLRSRMGRGVILVPTIAHWDAFRPRLEEEGVDVKAAQSRGQLTIVDADDLLPSFMRDAMPDSPVFLGLAADVITQVRGDGKYPKVRWWGEMVNVLWERGEVAASMNLDLFDQLSDQHGIAIFCSFLMDNFSGDVHARMLPRLGEPLSPYPR